MDILNQLFTLSVGVEPNKQTLQNLAKVFNGAVTSLSDQQKALSQFADSVEGQKFIANAPTQPQPQLTQPQIQYIQAAPTPQAAQARKAKILRDPVVWRITEQQVKELQWKRRQLLQAQKAELDRKKREQRAKRGPPPKLGPSRATSRAPSVISTAPSRRPGPSPQKGQNQRYPQQQQQGGQQRQGPKPQQGGQQSKPPGGKPAGNSGNKGPQKTPAKPPAKGNNKGPGK